MSAGTGQAARGFLKRLKRLVGIVPGVLHSRGDSEALELERRFLSERRASLGRELDRRIENLTYRNPAMGESIKRYAHDPLPDAWKDGELPVGMTSAIRPLRREIEVIDALEEAIVRRPLVPVIEGTLQRVEDEIADALRQARPRERYGETYWTDELLEQTLSHLLHLWAEWLHHWSQDEPKPGGGAR